MNFSALDIERIQTMQELRMLSNKGDEVLASWVDSTAAFLHAQEVVREKIRNGHILVKDYTEKTPEIVNELEVGKADYMLIPQPQGG